MRRLLTDMIHPSSASRESESSAALDMYTFFLTWNILIRIINILDK